MDTAGTGEQKERLTKAEAEALATELMEALRQLPLGGRTIDLEGLATLARLGLPFLETSPPSSSQIVPPLLNSLLGPLDIKLTDKELNSAQRKHREMIANPPKSAKDLHDSLKHSILKLPPAGISIVRKMIEKLRSHTANPVAMREQLVSVLRKNMKGRPGRKSSIPPEANDRLIESSRKLREVCLKLLVFSEKESKQPLAKVMQAIVSLRPDWNAECDFLSSHLELIEASLRLAKIKKSKTRGKASKLADALSCEFAGYSVSPSYSMQILEQARRSRRR